MEETVKKKRKWLIPVIIGGVTAVMFAIIAAVVVVVVLAATGPKGKYQKQLDLGEKYLAEMDYERALLAYEEAVKINPKAEAAYFGLAKVYEIMADEYIANGLMVEAAGYLDIAIDKLEEGYHYTSSEEMFSEAERLKTKRDSLKGGQPAEGESAEEIVDPEYLRKVCDLWVEFLNNPTGPDEEMGYLAGEWNNPKLRFALVYVDNDNVPELVVDNPDYMSWVFYYENGTFREGFGQSYGTWGNYYFCPEKTGYILNQPYWYETLDDGSGINHYYEVYIPGTGSTLPEYKIDTVARMTEDGGQEELGKHYYKNDVEINEQDFKAETAPFGFDTANVVPISGVQFTKQEVIEQLRELAK